MKELRALKKQESLPRSKSAAAMGRKGKRERIQRPRLAGVRGGRRK